MTENSIAFSYVDVVGCASLELTRLRQLLLHLEIP